MRDSVHMNAWLTYLAAKDLKLSF